MCGFGFEFQKQNINGSFPKTSEIMFMHIVLCCATESHREMEVYQRKENYEEKALNPQKKPGRRWFLFPEITDLANFRYVFK